MSKDQQDTSRDAWITAFGDGFDIGCRKGKTTGSPDFEDVADDGLSEFEYEAQAAGYEFGLGWYPGRDMNVEKKANETYDRSGYASGLDEWI